MKILIVGNKGQLGTELALQLKNGSCALGELPELYKDAEVVGVDIDTLNVADTEQTLAFVEQQMPDVIFNCAAYTNVDGCESDIESAMSGNAIAPRNLAMAARRVGAKLVHASTDYVFDGVADKPYTEASLPAPCTAYGRTKLLGEQYVASFCESYFIVRTAWLYGRTGKNFVRTMVALSKTKEFLNVVDDQYGCPTNAEDLAFHLLKMALTQHYGIYHCVGKHSTNWHGFATEILRLYGSDIDVRPCSSEQYKTPAKRPAYSVLSNTMLALTVGDDMRPWKDAIAAYIEEMRESLDG